MTLLRQRMTEEMHGRRSVRRSLVMIAAISRCGGTPLLSK